MKSLVRNILRETVLLKFFFVCTAAVNLIFLFITIKRSFPFLNSRLFCMNDEDTLIEGVPNSPSCFHQIQTREMEQTSNLMQYLRGYFSIFEDQYDAWNDYFIGSSGLTMSEKTKLHSWFCDGSFNSFCSLSFKEEYTTEILELFSSDCKISCHDVEYKFDILWSYHYDIDCPNNIDDKDVQKNLFFHANCSALNFFLLRLDHPLYNDEFAMDLLPGNSSVGLAYRPKRSSSDYVTSPSLEVFLQAYTHVLIVCFLGSQALIFQYPSVLRYIPGIREFRPYIASMHLTDSSKRVHFALYLVVSHVLPIVLALFVQAGTSPKLIAIISMMFNSAALLLYFLSKKISKNFRKMQSISVAPM